MVMVMKRDRIDRIVELYDTSIFSIVQLHLLHRSSPTDSSLQIPSPSLTIISPLPLQYPLLPSMHSSSPERNNALPQVIKPPSVLLGAKTKH